MLRWQDAGFALYVHWPFCQSKCPYCDFNSHVQGRIDEAGWVEAYAVELDRLGRELPGRVLRSIFFGGGTPSLMSPRLVSHIIEKAAQNWLFSNDIEITLEANPSSAEVGAFRDFRAAGVNRLSLGVQALNDSDLRRLGRLHDAKTALQAIEMSQKTFDRTSFDLIYARQNQSPEQWKVELTEALSFTAGHLSLYQLSIEEGTVFGERQQRNMLAGLPADDLAADLYVLTQELCDMAGIPAYEISNHAYPDDISRHNMVYWENGDYIGIGPGAHGRITDEKGQRFGTYCVASPQEWLDLVRKTKSGEVKRQSLSLSEWSEEYVMMGMRLSKGISLKEYEELFKKPLHPGAIERLSTDNFVCVKTGRLQATHSGRLLLNRIIQEIIA